MRSRLHGWPVFDFTLLFYQYYKNNIIFPATTHKLCLLHHYRLSHHHGAYLVIRRPLLLQACWQQLGNSQEATTEPVAKDGISSHISSGCWSANAIVADHWTSKNSPFLTDSFNLDNVIRFKSCRSVSA